MGIKLDDLIEKCVTCGGSGKSPKPSDSKRGSATYGRQVLPGQVPFPEIVPTSCEPCKGTGRRQLTESGQTLLEFIKIINKFHLV